MTVGMEGRVGGYRIVLPPGWVRIPLGEGAEKALEEEVYSRVKGTRWEADVRRVMAEQVAAARRGGGLDLYVPVRSRRGAPLAASFLVGQIVLAQGPAPEVVLAGLAGQGGSVRGMAGTLAVRREYVREPQAATPTGSRHVEYALAVPRDATRYLTVSFSAAGGLAGAFVELFDAMMTTFRWLGGGVVGPRSGTA
jgi:hypothetical protein